MEAANVGADRRRCPPTVTGASLTSCAGAVVLASIFTLFSSLLGLPLHIIQLDHAHYTQACETIQQEIELQQRVLYKQEP